MIINGKIVPEWYFRIRNPVQLGKHRVEAVADFGKSRRVIFIAKRHERKVQYLVRAVRENDLGRLHTEKRAERLHKRRTVWVGIKLKLFRRLFSRPDNGIARWKRRFVGVELDIFHVLRLFTGDIGLK